MYKLVLLCFLLRLSTSVAQEKPRDLIAILASSSTSDGAKFNYSYTTQHGISVQTSGAEGLEGQSNMKGTYRYILPDGQPAVFEWYADEFGFHVDSDLLPVAPVFPFPPPWGPNAFKQILHAQKQKERGLTYDGKSNTWIKDDSQQHDAMAEK